MIRAIHQYHPTITSGDAVSNDCFQRRRAVRAWGLASDLFADQALGGVRDVGTRADLARRARRDDVLLIHHSMGHDAVPQVARVTTRKAVIYHNITPSRYFAGLNEELRRYADIGRQQLGLLAAACDLGIGVSEFDRRELEEAGFRKTVVAPIVVDWVAFETAPDPEVERRLAGGGTKVLAVGQILPHKGIHDVVAGFARYRDGDPGARLFIVGSTAMSDHYLPRIERQIHDSGAADAITLTGSVSLAALIAYYRCATVLLNLSEHEGFGVPLLEAMRFRVPVIAHAAGAMPETMGDAGLLLSAKAPDDVAAALERVVRDEGLRAELVARGERRVAEFSRERAVELFRTALAAGGIDVPPRRRSLWRWWR